MQEARWSFRLRDARRLQERDQCARRHRRSSVQMVDCAAYVLSSLNDVSGCRIGPPRTAENAYGAGPKQRVGVAGLQKIVAFQSFSCQECKKVQQAPTPN